jgi:phospholipid/cholesterol/gamma-HCH transport system substrate-binding protein
MLRKGTRASIKTRGLLGDKYIELEGGKATEPEVAVGGEIPAAPGAGIEKFLEGSGDLLTDLGAIAKSLKNILGRTEIGEGFLGAITSNSEESKQLGNNFNETLRSLNRMLQKIEKGQGLAGKLLLDEKYGRETTASLAAAVRSVERLLARIDEGFRTGSGAVPALLSDPEGKKKVYALVDSLATAAASLARITENLEKGSGALPILLHDEHFGKAFTGNLKNFSQSLDSIGRKLDGGQGTAGKLINDPQIFDAARRLVVGIDESALLRWLIKNRQRAGIKKEYSDTIKPQGTPPVPAEPTPPPSTPE